MHDDIAIQNFIHLRALGKSYAKIYQELGVPRSTLARWGHTYRNEIQEQRALECEAVQEQCFQDSRLQWEHLASQLQQVQRELSIRPLGDVSTVALFNLAARLRSEIEREKSKLLFPETASSDTPCPSDPSNQTQPTT